MKRSAEILHNTIPNSTLKILKDYYHEDLSISHPNKYIDLLTQLPLNK